MSQGWASVPSGSVTVGQSAFSLATKDRAGAASSLKSTPTTLSPSAAWRVSAAARMGNSSRHGPHQDAQKLTRTGDPRSAARSNGAPSSVVPASAGAASPMSGEPIWITDEAGVMATPPVAQPASTAERRPRAAMRAAGWSRGCVREVMRMVPVPGGRRPDPLVETSRRRVWLLDRQGADHVRVDGADEGVRAGRQGRHVVGPGPGPAEDLALEDLCAGGRALVGRDVMGGPRVVVREVDLEGCVGRGRELGRVVGDPARGELEGDLGARHGAPRGGSRSGAGGGCR